MNAVQMRNARRVLGVSAAVLVICVSATLVAIGIASRNARSFCSQFSVGSSMDAAARAAEGAGSDRFRTIRPNMTRVVYFVWPISAHTCIIDGVNGKVTKARYVPED